MPVRDCLLTGPRSFWLAHRSFVAARPAWLTVLAAWLLAGVALAGAEVSAAPPTSGETAAVHGEDLAATTPHWSSPEQYVPSAASGGDLGWPVVRPETRPGAYWWWPASAVTKDDLTWNLETYRRAGWGNLGVIGIYGVHGAEDRFIDIFSPRWFSMFNHAVTEARRLGMNIDLTASSGWRMGGPHVTPQHGEMSFAVKDNRIIARPLAAKVKRAGPGGEGLAINPYSQAAVTFHLDWMSQRFEQGNGLPPRAFYYDSFENPGNWCPEMLGAFRTLRSYSLEDHAGELGGLGQPHEVRRVVYDYRRTLSDVLLDRVAQIVRWGNRRGSSLRMQAHGAPANLLDMYAAAEIPETEVFGASRFDIPGFRRDPRWIRPEHQSHLVNRFASSAAHVAGRKLIISESFTWLRNHFHTALAHIKAEADNLWLNGINGIYYHGICYAPEKTAWPGWLFYASTEANARNSIFRDVPVLNAYITRCQSVLQSGAPHNDILLYWPIDDLWMGAGNKELRFSVHRPEWIEETACGQAGRWLIERGYTFDFISDRQLQHVRVDEGQLVTSGGSRYQAVLLPAAEFMRVETAQQILALGRSGATILVWQRWPQDVPGWLDHAARQGRLARLLAPWRRVVGESGSMGQGRFVVSDDLAALMNGSKIARESMVDHDLRFIRRRHAQQVTYFIANQSAQRVDTWVPIATRCRSAVLMDPMTGRSGVAATRGAKDGASVYLQLRPGETRVLRVFPDKQINGDPWPIIRWEGPAIPVEGTWQVEFVEGGPVLPESYSTDKLASWTQAEDEQAHRFAGAARYTISIDVPAGPTHWVLELGDVRESARVELNGSPVGVAVAHPFRVDLGKKLRPGPNEIAIEITNLSANRIRDLDLRGVPWKKFYDINIVDQNYKPFDASRWDLEPSGLLGPVTLVPYRLIAPPNHTSKDP